LGRAAQIAFRELKDTEQAFAWLGDALVTFVDEGPLTALERLADEVGEPRRAESVLSRALEEVFDGPLVRKLLAHRAAVRRDKLADKPGAAGDLKRLHDLSPSDTAVMDQLSQLYVELEDYRGMVQLYEDQILRGKDPGSRAELARKVARLWEEKLGDPREAADAWRRVLRMKAGDPEATEGLDRAKANMLKRPVSEPDAASAPVAAAAPPVAAKAAAPAKPKAAVALPPEPAAAEEAIEKTAPSEPNASAAADVPPAPDSEQADAPPDVSAAELDIPISAEVPITDTAESLPEVALPASSGFDRDSITESAPNPLPALLNESVRSSTPPPLPPEASSSPSNAPVLTNGAAGHDERDGDRVSTPPSSVPGKRVPPPKPAGKRPGAPPPPPPSRTGAPPPPPRTGAPPAPSVKPPPPPAGAARPAPPPPPGSRSAGKPPAPPAARPAVRTVPPLPPAVPSDVTELRAAPNFDDEDDDGDELTVDEDELIDDKL